MQKGKREELFNRYQYLSGRVRLLSGIVQNAGTPLEEQYVEQWLEEYNNVIKDLKKLKEDSVSWIAVGGTEEGVRDSGG